MKKSSALHTVSQQMGGWVVEMSWPEGEIQGGPSALSVRPADPDHVPVGGLSQTVLRGVDFRAAGVHAREQAEAGGALERIREKQRPPRVAMPLLQAMLDSSGITDVYLVLLATEYLARVERGDSKPVDHIAEELGKSLPTIKGHLWKARKQGLLKGGGAGRKGGYIPPEAADIAIEYLDRATAALAATSDAPVAPTDTITVEHDPPEVVEHKPIRSRTRK